MDNPPPLCGMSRGLSHAGLEAGPPGTFLEAQGAGARAGGLCGGMPAGGFPETGHSSWERFPARPAPPGPGHSRQMGGAGRHCQGEARPQTAHARTGATGGPVRTHLCAWAMPGASSAPRVQTWAAREPQKAPRIHADPQAPADRYLSDLLTAPLQHLMVGWRSVDICGVSK